MNGNRVKGIVLISVIIILLTISIIGASLLTFFSSVDLSSRIIIDQAKAFYLSEAGISYAISVLRNKADDETNLDRTIGPISLGDGTYTVKIDFLQSLITSTGKVRDVEKTVQLQYSVL